MRRASIALAVDAVASTTDGCFDDARQHHRE